MTPADQHSRTRATSDSARSIQEIVSAGLDDLVVGAHFVTRGRTITEADVVSFAALTGDFHPQHVDAVWARESVFGERIAHGALVLSYAVGLMPLDPSRVIALRRIGDAVFKRPVRLGDTIAVEATLERAGPIDDAAGLTTWRWSIVNQDRQIVARARVELVWSRG